MKNLEVLESNYPPTNGDYKDFQLKLPLDISTVVPADDLVTSFASIMKSMDTSKYFNDVPHRGNKGYDPKYNVAGCTVCLYERRLLIKKNRKLMSQ